MADDTMLAWAAGFFDGEGTIGIFAVQGQHRLTIAVSQIVEDPLRRLQSLFGGWVGLVNKGKPQRFWQWQASAGTALAALSAMAPYLTVKRDEAALAIEFQSDRAAAHRPRRGYSPFARNEHFRLALRQIKAERRMARR